MVSVKVVLHIFKKKMKTSFSTGWRSERWRYSMDEPGMEAHRLAICTGPRQNLDQTKCNLSTRIVTFPPILLPAIPSVSIIIHRQH